MSRFAEVERYPQGTGTLIPLYHNKVTEQLEPGTGWPTSPIPGRLSAVPVPTSSPRPLHRMSATESGEPLAFSVTDSQTPPPVSLHRLDLFESQHRVGDVLVIREQREVIADRHTGIVLQVAA